VIPHEIYVYFLLGLSIALLLGTLWVLNVLARSPFGRIVRALREDDVVAATLGKNVLWARVRIFAIGGAFIGLAGSLHAFYYQYIDPTQFTNIVIAYAFMAVIAGGPRRARGRDLGRRGRHGAARRVAVPQGRDPLARFRPARRDPDHHHRRRADPAADLPPAGLPARTPIAGRPRDCNNETSLKRREHHEPNHPPHRIEVRRRARARRWRSRT
jgi:hypothetical protein